MWDVATHQDGTGWAAEFRIPMSQLRFASERERPWGLQITRDIIRRNEFDLWRPIAKNQDRWVSQYGDLSGLEQVSPPRRLDVDRIADDPWHRRISGRAIQLNFGSVHARPEWRLESQFGERAVRDHFPVPANDNRSGILCICPGEERHRIAGFE